MRYYQIYGKISKDFTEYEGLIYDGAYSNHITEMKPVMLENQTNISKEDAKKKARQILENTGEDVKIEYINSKGESKGKIDVYSFNAKYKGKDYEINIDISKKGGFLVLLVSDREVKEKKISEEDAENIGIEYLKKIGIDNMKATYHLVTENMITINYASTQNNIVLYPDLIKVKITMDTGEVCSTEASGYIFNHKIRDNVTTSVSPEQAKSVLAPNIEILSEGIAIIPNEAKSEVLTYEFKGRINGKEFLIYVNANTGKEEKVLLIINTPGGTLTM